MKLQARVASQCSPEIDDAYWTALIRAARTELTEEQMSIMYLRLHHKMGLYAIAEALKMSPAEVYRAENEARDRIPAALRRDDRRS